MDKRTTQTIGVLGGILTLGSYAVVTGRAVEITTEPVYLLVTTALGLTGAVIEQMRNSTILGVIWAAVTGGCIAVLVTSGTWFEVLFAFFSGGTLVMIGWHALDP
ncbi:hypothetical protein [Natrinema sp. SYSU A 869]|uniref:hypothetical protein n=1 Tax=Natrinema sp. SYSU A 869 TaxID=2871694 RepID=UPI001CA3B152|nr:hypothetical protein [Natrinema sp. SYSU A 869]